MGKTYEGSSEFSSNFKINKAAPISDTDVIDTLADLTNPETWKVDGEVMIYKDITTTVGNDPVADNNGLYWLRDTDYTDIANWEKIGSGGSGEVLPIHIINGDDLNNYTTVGWYLVDQSDGRISNMPSSFSGSMHVIYSPAGGDPAPDCGRMQILYVAPQDGVTNMWLRKANRDFEWNAWHPVDKLTFDEDIEYDAGDVVAHSGIFYQSLQDNNEGNTPTTSLSNVWWKVFGSNYVSNNDVTPIKVNSIPYFEDDTGKVIKSAEYITAISSSATNILKLSGKASGTNSILLGSDYYNTSGRLDYFKIDPVDSTQDTSSFKTASAITWRGDKNGFSTRNGEFVDNIKATSDNVDPDKSLLTEEGIIALVDASGGGSGLVIAPQTIVAGNVGSIPSTWSSGACNPLAEHLEDGSNEIYIKEGLQVCAGVSGTAVLSNVLGADTALNVSGLADGKHYVYADLDDNGDMAFGSTDVEPLIDTTKSIPLSYMLPPFSSNSAVGWGSLTGINAYTDPTSGNLWKVFNQTALNSSDQCTFYLGTPYASIIYTGAFRGKIAGYSITSRFDSSSSGRRPPIDWSVSTSTATVTDTVIDTQTGYTTWDSAETKTFVLDTPIDTTDIESIKLEVTDFVAGAYTNGVIARFDVLVELDHDFYNTADQTHYDKDGNILKRVYIGECEVISGTLVDLINYQHGTTVTLPINEGNDVAINSEYYLDRPYLGYCTSTARIYAEGKWGKTGFIYNSGGQGTASNMTDGVLSIKTGTLKLSSHNGGSEFVSTDPTSAPAKVTVQRGW